MSEGFVFIVSVIKSLPALEILSLANNNQSEASFNLLRKLAKSSLNTLNLSNCWIESASLGLLCDSMLLMPRMRTLILSENHFESAQT
jgi:Leucine-rich repeat (LRR) protein